MRTGEFHTVEEAIEEIQTGRMVIVVDDEDRENEGDLIIAAEKATPEAINFMATHAKGLICMPMTAERLDELKIQQMVEQQHREPGDRLYGVRGRGHGDHRHFRLRTRPDRQDDHRPCCQACRPAPPGAYLSAASEETAACCGGPGTPRPPLTWRGWPASIRPGSSARS